MLYNKFKNSKFKIIVEISVLTETHFGEKTVKTEEKQGLVNEVFSNVADKYDLMNDVMSLGIHR